MNAPDIPTREAELDAPRVSRFLARALPVALLALGTLARLLNLDAHGAWEDELVRWVLASGNYQAMAFSNMDGPPRIATPPDVRTLGTLKETYQEIKVLSPYGPVYYTLLHGAARLLDGGLGLLRFASLVASVLSALLLWHLAARWGPVGPPAVLSFWALSGWDIGVGLQGREYALTGLLVLLTTWALLRLLEARRAVAGWVVLYGLIVFAAVGTQYFGAFILPAQGLFVLYRAYRERCRAQAGGFRVIGRWLAGLGVAAVPALVWVRFAMAAQTAADGIRPYWVVERPWRELPGMVWRFLHHAFLPFRTGFGSATDVVLTLVVVVLVVIGGSGVLRRHGESSTAARLAGLELVSAMGLLVAAYLVFGLHHALWPRYSLPFLHLAWLCAGAGLAALVQRIAAPARRMAVGSAALAAVLAVGATQVVALRRASLDDLDRHLDYRAITETLRAEIRPDDVLVHWPPYAALLAFHYHWRTSNPVLVGPLPESLELLARPPRPRRVWLLVSWYNARAGEPELDRDVRAKELVAEFEARAGLKSVRRINAAGLIALCFERSGE
ncbi:MAG: hypothetical protein HY825_10055 [Acidobacteria bacterium]|nr:hypothetical protein [Acidobacteriota bacterium]